MADEIGVWKVDPSNPNRAFYLDENGDEYEIFKPSAVPLVNNKSGQVSDGFEENDAQKAAATEASKTGYFSDSIARQGGWGLSPETRRVLGANDGPNSRFGGERGYIDDVIDPLANAPANIADLAFRGMQAGQAGLETAGQGLDDVIDATGINDTSLVKDYLPGKIEPGKALLALAEAFPLGGLEMGHMPTFKTPERKATLAENPLNAERQAFASEADLTAEAKALYDNPNSTRADFTALAEKYGRNDDWRNLDEALESRNNRQQFVSQIQNAEDANTMRVQLGLDNKARADEIFKAKLVDPDLPKSAEAGVEHVANITKDWNNPPPIEIADDFANLADETLRDNLDPSAIGVTTPEGKVLISMKNVAAEAKARNVSQEDILSAVTYHEALGHYGMAQKFGDELDDILMNLVDNSKGTFAQRVDEWETDNPNAYANDPNPRARAAEEVLAEMSEAGQIPYDLRDAFRNWIKDTGREFGLDLKYSDKEIRTILGMSHNAVVSGMGRDVIGNGFKYARVWHGSPQDFDSFSHQSKDEGRGTQLLGHGTYVTDDMEYAKAYRGGPTGKLYEVDVPDSNWGDWDKKLADQPEMIEKLKAAGFEARKSDTLGQAYQQAAFEYGAKEVSDKLSEQGLKGHAYKDYDGTQNYVVYKPEDVKIVNKYMRRTAANDDFKKASDPGAIPDQPKADAPASEQAAYFRAYAVHMEEKAKIWDQRGNADAAANARNLAEGFRDDAAYWAKKSISNRNMRRSDVKEEAKKVANRSRSINIDNISNVRDIDYILERADEMAPEGEGRVPREVTERLARDLGLTPSRLLKPGMDEKGLAARIEGGTQLLVNQIGKVDNILSKMQRASDKEAARLNLQFSKEMATLAAVYGRVAGNNSEVGRALSILNKVRNAKGTAEEIMRYMAKSNNVLGNPANAQKLAGIIQQASSPSAKVRLATAAMKPRAEDFIFRIWYNMMLSSPATHTANMLGTLGNFTYDLLEKTGGAAIGQAKRGSNMDRIRGREVAYRMYGAYRALRDGSTWRNTIDSYKTGLTGNSTNSKTGGSSVYQGNNKIAKPMSYVLEGPSRALAAEDEWWRNVISLSNIYGLSVRNAGNKGLTGPAFWNEVENLINNPTTEMIDATNDYTKVLQFLDKPSRIARAVNKMTDTDGKTSAGGRAFSTVAKLVVPFVNTPDALIRTSLRRTPIGIVERENIKAFKAGGAERDQLVSRMVMGSLLSAWVASKAADGDITGEGPSDPRKRMEWEAAHQPNSIKVGDKEYSIAGLEPVSTNLTAIATLVERYRAGEMTKDDYIGSALNAATGFGKVLMENSYTENLKNVFKMLEGDDTAAANLAGGIASNLTTPGVLRTIARADDPATRDTTGDGSATDRIEGRIQSGSFDSEELPQRYDVYGQPIIRDTAGPDIASRVQRREKSDDPAINELNRLVDAQPDAVVVGAPGKNVKVGDEKRRLNAEEYQQYQRLSGYWIVESVRQEMNTPEWASMSDEAKIVVIKDIVKDMRTNARELLFQADGEDNE